ncbi:hypothetical protein IFR05_017037 [Cadophora sp. M221]|nr:hypothetical protein IFR05_017037 [Cadophora sp. M221]
MPAVTTSVQYSGLQCEDCNRIFETKAQYKRHRNRHTRPWKCQETGCTMAFASSNDLKRHNNSKHPSTSKAVRFVCPIFDCSYQRGGFGRKDHLLRHIRRAHGGENGLPQAPHLIHENLDEEIFNDGEQRQPGAGQGGDGTRLDDNTKMTMEWETTASCNENSLSAQGIYGEIGTLRGRVPVRAPALRPGHTFSGGRSSNLEAQLVQISRVAGPAPAAAAASAAAAAAAGPSSASAGRPRRRNDSTEVAPPAKRRRGAPAVAPAARRRTPSQRARRFAELYRELAALHEEEAEVLEGEEKTDYSVSETPRRAGSIEL